MTPFSTIVYINGVLFYPSSVTVTATRNELARFSVTLPGVPELDLLPPRSHGVVFYTEEVSQTWRLMVEGEYISDNKVKTSDGQRHVTLEFRSLFGAIESATNTTFSSLSYRGVDSADASLTLKANDKPRSPTGNAAVDIQHISVLVSSLANSSLVSSEFFPALIRLIFNRIPVEGFYAVERKVYDKIYALPDEEIVKVMEPARLKDLSNFYATSRTQEGQTLLSLINDYEQMMFYQHLPLLSPPRMAGSKQINSLMFTPLLYNVIPPACNVVFMDQITELSRGRNYALEPTRVIAKLQTFEGKGVPVIYMANNVVNSVDVGLEAKSDYSTNNPAVGATHTLHSPDELQRGVVAHTLGVRHTSLQPNSLTSASWQTYYDRATRHYFNVVSGNYRTSSLSCVFLPNIAVGLPCLIEDYSGPFHAYVESVTHILSNGSAPRTLLTMSQMRPAFVMESTNRTPPLPGWLNRRYLPSGIKRAPNSENGTWDLLLGKNALSTVSGGYDHGAMVPASEIKLTGPTSATVVDENYSKEQIDMDGLAASVIPIPVYTKNLDSAKFSTGTVAEGLRDAADPNLAMAAFNYRAGTDIVMYAEAHGLEINDGARSYKDGAAPPPTLFDESKISLDGTPMFSFPCKLVFTGKASGKYGVADPVRGETSGALYNPLGQKAALLVARAISRGITRC